MKNLYFLIIALLTAISSYGQVQITEISYLGTNLADQKIEITGPALTDLTGYRLYFYGNPSPSGVKSYNNFLLSGTITDTGSGYGALSFTMGFDITDTGNTSVVLVDPLGVVVPGTFWSWGTSFVANQGPAGGLTPVATNVIQSATTSSLKLNDGGVWVDTSPQDFGTLNTNLTLSVVKNQIENFAMYPNPVSNGMLYMSSSNNVNKQVAIYAINGQQVYSKSLQLEETMNISNLNRGIYFVRIEEEGKISTRKLVVN